MFNILAQYHHLLFQGFLTTIKLFGIIMLIGVPLGICIGLIGGRYSQETQKSIEGARFLTKVIPTLVFLFWFHYPLQGILGLVIDPFWTTAFVLGAINTVNVSSTISSELKLLPKIYREAALTLGLSLKEAILHIELPLLVRRATPQILFSQASMLEYTLFGSLISVPELFRTAQSINAIVYKPVEIYSLLMLFFLMILAPLHLTASWFKKNYHAEYD